MSRLDAMLDAEPSALEALTPDQKNRLTEVLDRYLASLEKGMPLTPESLVEAHPDLAQPLNTYLRCLAELHDVAVGFTPAAAIDDTSKNADDACEKRLGDFVLLREIGHGGMGVVYEAEQVSLGRRVALKVLPFAAVLDSRQIARFKNEAQAAAQLNHPHIVPVYAVGSERGVHYYAMQLIDGRPLDQLIEELRTTASDMVTYSKPAKSVDRHDATTSALVSNRASRQTYYQTVARLGVQAAEALYAAHSDGILHRDIKPSNLLVDAEGKLWVTDFGLARCQSDLALTRTGDVVGTRHYMSPEQAFGQGALVDQRSDVYSLGVTLYEMLSLRSPFGDDVSVGRYDDTYQREPIRLKHWEPELSRDLETVVLKAMACSREDRYLTAQELADDLTRVLEGKPTLARPLGAADRIGRWARRHRRLVVAAGIIVAIATVALSIGNILISREKTRSEQNFQRAERHFREAQEVVDRFGSRLAERLKDVPGADGVRREVLEETLRYYENFVEEAGSDPALRTELALTHSKIGTLAEQIGSVESAITAQTNALRLFEQLIAEQPDSVDLRRHAGICQNNLALALQRASRTEHAREAFLKTIEWQKQLVASAADPPPYQQDLALTYNNLGLLLGETGKQAEAERAFQDAIKIQERLVQELPEDADRLRALAASLNNLAAIQNETTATEALALYQRASTYQARAALARPDEVQHKCDLALTFNNLAAAQSRVGQYETAAASFARAIEIQEPLVRVAPLQRTYRRDLAVSYNNLGMMQSKLGKPTEAEQSFEKALQLQEVLVSQNPQEIDLASSLGGIYNNLGIVEEELDRPKEAAESYRKAIEYQRTAFARARSIDRYRNFLSKHYYNYGRTLRHLGRGDEAAQVALKRRDLWPNDPERLFAIAEELALASQILAKQALTADVAEQYTYQAIELLQRAKSLGMRMPADLLQNESFAQLVDYPQFMTLVHN